jgi:hypothetical protein
VSHTLTNIQAKAGVQPLKFLSLTEQKVVLTNRFRSSITVHSLERKPTGIPIGKYRLNVALEADF